MREAPTVPSGVSGGNDGGDASGMASGHEKTGVDGGGTRLAPAKVRVKV